MKCEACGRETADGVRLDMNAANSYESMHGNRKVLTRQDMVPFSMFFCNDCLAKARRRVGTGQKVLSSMVLVIGAACIGLLLWAHVKNLSSYVILAVIFLAFWAAVRFLTNRMRTEIDRAFIVQVAGRVRALNRNSWSNGRSWQQM
ncbi:MAG: hypothetical protein ACYC6V_06990 [Bacillota bacterium]